MRRAVLGVGERVVAASFVNWVTRSDSSWLADVLAGSSQASDDRHSGPKKPGVAIHNALHVVIEKIVVVASRPVTV